MTRPLPPEPQPAPRLIDPNGDTIGDAIGDTENSAKAGAATDEAGRLGPGRTTAAMSLTRRLTLLLAMFLSVGGVVIALLAASYGRQAAEQTYDRLLLGAAGQIAAAISVQDGQIITNLPVSAFELLAQAPDDRLFYAVIDPKGGLVTGDELAFPQGRGTRFFDGVDQGEATRFVALERIFAERGFAGVVTVVVGQTALARADLAAEITRNALAISALAGGLLVLLAVLVTRAALGPLRSIEAALIARAPQDLTALNLPVPREIARLVAALNGFMSRLDRTMSMNSRLLADASHQIRTPIAALRAQAELAADEPDPARLRRIAGRIHARAIDLTRLTEQMLSRAMIIHRADAAPQTLVDLRDVAMDAAEEVGDAQPNRRRDLRLDLPDTPVLAMADDLSLREAAKNLVMNALIHGKPPVRIQVRGETLGPHHLAVVAVQDAGMGPLALPAGKGPPKAMGSSKGTGLGLQIVRAVAAAHGGVLATRKGPNSFEAAIELPAATSPEKGVTR